MNIQPKKGRRVLAIGAAAVSAMSVTPTVSAADQQIIVTGTRPPCCGVTMSFDDFMTGYTSPYSSTSFSVPEGEAYKVAGYKDWLQNQVVPKAAIKMSVCVTTDSQMRSTTKNDEPTYLDSIANQLYFTQLPNFVNRDKDGLILSTRFSDGTVVEYRHTSMYGLLRTSTPVILGTGIPGSDCTG